MSTTASRRRSPRPRPGPRRARARAAAAPRPRRGRCGTRRSGSRPSSATAAAGRSRPGRPGTAARCSRAAVTPRSAPRGAARDELREQPGCSGSDIFSDATGRRRRPNPFAARRPRSGRRAQSPVTSSSPGSAISWWWMVLTATGFAAECPRDPRAGRRAQRVARRQDLLRREPVELAVAVAGG